MRGLPLHTVPSNINMIPSPGMSACLTFRRYCLIPTAERSLVLKRPAHAYSRNHDLERILQQNDARAFRCTAFCASDRIACCMGNLASTFPCALLAVLSGRHLYAYNNNRTTDRISMEFDAGKFHHIFQLWLLLVKNDTRCT